MIARKFGPFRRPLDILYLVILMAYILLGVQLTPFHGDEATQIFMARDTFDLIHGEWDRLLFSPDKLHNQEQALRLINGTLNKTFIGFMWMVSGHFRFDLPGLYDWHYTLDTNRQFGHVPSASLLVLSRWPSALLTALGLLPLFGLMWRLAHSRPIAYVAVLLYTVNPVILLNGRRAMMEGSLLFTALLVMNLLITVAQTEQNDSQDTRQSILRYGIIGLLVGFAMAAKFTNLPVGAALAGAILLTGLQPCRRHIALVRAVVVLLVGGITWFVWNPAYWRDPLPAAQQMVEYRSWLLAMQAKSTSAQYKTLPDRLPGMIDQAFFSQPQYYELDEWQPFVSEQVAAYEASPWGGWGRNIVWGSVLLLAAGMGTLALFRRAQRHDTSARVILFWLGAALLQTLVIPMGWQRYYLPLILVLLIPIALGFQQLIQIAHSTWVGNSPAMWTWKDGQVTRG